MIESLKLSAILPIFGLNMFIRKLTFTIFFISCTCVSFSQLIEDNDSRLKQHKVARDGFLFFRNKKNIRGSEAQPQSKRKINVNNSPGSPYKSAGKVTPRGSNRSDRAKRYSVKVKYSSGSPFRGNTRDVSPRVSKGNPFRGGSYSKDVKFSAGNPFRNINYEKSPRYSPSNPFRGRKYHIVELNSVPNPFRGINHKIAPRYSPSNPFKGLKYNVKPNYSSPNPFRGQKHKLAIRYSPSNPFKGAKYKIEPRYSPSNPFKGLKYNIAPRYSIGNPFRSEKHKVEVRYSPSNPFKGTEYKIEPRYSNTGDDFNNRFPNDYNSPRYSPGIPFRDINYKVKPRYSEGMPFKTKDYKVRPRYTGTSYGAAKKMLNKELRLISYYHETSHWKGDLKIKRKQIGDQHPSSNYHFAKKFSDPSVRKLLRKWNVYWTRLNGTKQQSKNVRKDIEEPKFDKKEKVLWNN